MIGEG